MTGSGLGLSMARSNSRIRWMTIAMALATAPCPAWAQTIHTFIDFADQRPRDCHARPKAGGAPVLVKGYIDNELRFWGYSTWDGAGQPHEPGELARGGGQRGHQLGVHRPHLAQPPHGGHEHRDQHHDGHHHDRQQCRTESCRASAIERPHVDASGLELADQESGDEIPRQAEEHGHTDEAVDERPGRGMLAEDQKNCHATDAI